MYLGSSGTITLGGDWNGDGVQDMLAGSQYYYYGGWNGNSVYGYTYLVSGADFAGAAASIDEVDLATVTGTYYTMGLVQGPQGDLTGDGIDDPLLTAMSSYYSGYGAVYLFEGGSSFSGDLTDESAIAYYTGDSNGDNTHVGVAADIDGDGTNEVITGNSGDNLSGTNTSSGAVTIFSGMISNGYDLQDADGIVNGVDDYDYLGYQLTAADLDNDGYADLILGAYGVDNGANNAGAIYVVGGGSLSFADDTIDNCASLEIDNTTVNGSLGYDPLAVPEDLDGDGTIDFAFSSKATGKVWIWWDASAQTGTTTVASASVDISGTAGSFASGFALSDWDGDGWSDLIVGDSGNDTYASNAGAIWIYTGPAGWGTGMGTGGADSDGVLWGESSNDALGSALAGHLDTDNDGVTEFVAGASGNDGVASNGGALYLVEKQ